MYIPILHKVPLCYLQLEELLKSFYISGMFSILALYVNIFTFYVKILFINIIHKLLVLSIIDHYSISEISLFSL